MKLEIDIDEDYYKIICKRVEENKPYHSPHEYEAIADGKPLEQEPVLDKIRTEIDNALSDGMIHKKTVLGIIDKYKSELNPQESEDKE